jgi:hypothetical protein
VQSQKLEAVGQLTGGIARFQQSAVGNTAFDRLKDAASNGAGNGADRCPRSPPR